MSPSQKVTVYSSPFCGYCRRALALLKGKGADVAEIDVTMEPGKREEAASRSGRTSLPQIFVGETHVGGYSDLAALEARGALDPLLET